MASSRDTHDAEQRPNMWEELNRPREDRRPPHAPAPPSSPPSSAMPPAPSDADGAADLVGPHGGEASAATTMARIDPQHLLLVGAVLFVAVTFFALRGLGGSDAGPDTQAGSSDEAAAAQSPDQLAAFDEVEAVEDESEPPTPPTTAQPTAPQPTPMAMGLPAELLDSAQSQVFRLYRTALGREPDRRGFMFWSDRVRDGVPAQRLADEFLASAEYQEQFASEAAWADRAEHLLENAFGPAADQAELDARLARFAGLEGALLLLAISEAEETLAATGTLR